MQFGGDEVVKAKDGAGSATLSMAYAGYRCVVSRRYMTYWLTVNRFAEKVIKAAKGEKGIVEPSFVYLPGVTGGDAISKITGTEFFSVPIELGVSGARACKRIETDIPHSLAVLRRRLTSSVV